MLVVENVSKTYESAAGPLPILNDVSFELNPGEAIASMGPSGSGKSTLLHILGGLDTPTSGRVGVNEADPFAGNERQRAGFRNQHVGFVFQDHSLLPQCTVLENVLVPTLVLPDSAKYQNRARELLDLVGLTSRLRHRPGELSGGERQRVAIARAMICNPALLLCDEPTGNLDQASAASVADLLLDVHGRQESILIVVTHSAELAARLPRTLLLKDRKLVQVEA